MSAILDLTSSTDFPIALANSSIRDSLVKTPLFTLLEISLRTLKSLSEKIANVPKRTTISIEKGIMFKSYKDRIIEAIKTGKQVNTEVN